jgi:hypothetical protein
MNILKNNIFTRDILLVCVLLIVTIVAAFNSFKQPNTSHLSNYCKPPSITNGTDTIKAYISQPASYVVWVHLETPMQIDFNNDLPGVYNPLLVAVDNSNCYEVGGSETVALNTWTWINYLNTNPAKTFKINLNSGVHIFSITGSYASIDRLELLSNNCTPINNGSNCQSQSKQVTYIP